MSVLYTYTVQYLAYMCCRREEENIASINSGILYHVGDVDVGC